MLVLIALRETYLKAHRVAEASEHYVRIVALDIKINGQRQVNRIERAGLTLSFEPPNIGDLLPTAVDTAVWSLFHLPITPDTVDVPL
jgi:hypothetical protein